VGSKLRRPSAEPSILRRCHLYQNWLSGKKKPPPLHEIETPPAIAAE
jgi:hypothetical protein